jgi:c-di-GMP-binding flagellar brake protein YcgR
MFLDTQPTELDALAAKAGSLREFRMSAPPELRALLKRLAEGNVLVNLNASDGTVYTTTIWAVDDARERLTLAADAADPRVQRLIEADDVVVVAYLDSIKIQFDLQGLVLVHASRASALQAAIPRLIYRFQRRSSYRVRPLERSAPAARMRHPALPEMQLELRIVDVSVGGCALFLPDDVPPLQPGIEMAGVAIELDADTRFETRLRLHHVTAINPGSRGSRLGCSMEGMSRDAERMLQRYIDQTQKRRRMLAL